MKEGVDVVDSVTSDGLLENNEIMQSHIHVSLPQIVDAAFTIISQPVLADDGVSVVEDGVIKDVVIGDCVVKVCIVEVCILEVCVGAGGIGSGVVVEVCFANTCVTIACVSNVLLLIVGFTSVSDGLEVVTCGFDTIADIMSSLKRG